MGSWLWMCGGQVDLFLTYEIHLVNSVSLGLTSFTGLFRIYKHLSVRCMIQVYQINSYSVQK